MAMPAVSSRSPSIFPPWTSARIASATSISDRFRCSSATVVDHYGSDAGGYLEHPRPRRDRPLGADAALDDLLVGVHASAGDARAADCDDVVQRPGLWE